MKVKRSALIPLLVAMGWGPAAKFDKKKLLEKIESIPKFLNDKEAQPETDDQRDLQKQLVAALEKKDDIEIDMEDDKKDDAPKGKGKGKAAAEKKDDPDRKPTADDKKDDDKDKKPAKKKDDAPKKPGVIATIIEQLKKGNKADPVTKDEILKVCVKRFPERQEAAMKSTINSQIPSGLKTEKNLEVKVVELKEGKKGYYLP